MNVNLSSEVLVPAALAGVAIWRAHTLPETEKAWKTVLLYALAGLLGVATIGLYFKTQVLVYLVGQLGINVGSGSIQERPLYGLKAAVALEIVLEGRVFGAQEAREKGLVNRVVPDDKVEAETLAAARRIAEGAPLVARWHKRFARRLADPRPLSPEENDESYACFDTEDFRTGYRAFLAKEKPRFRGK